MKKLLIVFTLFIIGASNSFASHVMAADITYVCLGGNQYEVTLRLYRDCFGSTIGQTSQSVSFSSSCGTFSQALAFVSMADVSQVCAGQTTTCNGGTLPGTEEYTFRGIVSLPPCANWKMSWSLCCRNAGITNLSAPSSASLYIENTLNNLVGTCNNSPSFSALPTPYVCIGQLISYNHGATDIDGDSLYYNFNQPLTAAASTIAFASGYTLLDPIITSAGMNLNNFTGAMCFTPSQAQICVVSVLISEYRNGALIGTYIREMQIVVQSTCSNQPPVAGSSSANCGQTGGLVITNAGPSVFQVDSNSITMCPLDTLCFQISFSDPDLNMLDVVSNIATAIPTASWTIIGNGTQSPVANFCWVPTPLDSGINVFSVAITDDACPVTATTYATYDITVYDQPYAGPDQTLCGPQTAQIQAVGGGGYIWSVVSGDPMNVGVNFSCDSCDNPIANPAVTTTYLLTSTIGAACVNTDTITIFRVPDFNQSAIPDTSVCVFGGALIPVQLITSPDSTGYVYDWNNGGTLNDSTISTPIATPTVTTDYIVTITSPLGCVKTDTATVSVTTFPAIAISGDTTNCPGDSVNLFATAGSGYSYSWTPTLETTQNVWADSGQYVAEITVNGCVGYTDTVNVSIIYLDQPIVNDTAFCPTSGGVVVSVQNPGSYSYSWDPPVGVGTSVTINQAGSYVVHIIDNIGANASGCEVYSDTITVTQIPTPTPNIAGNLFYCKNDSTTLSVGSNWTNIQWYDITSGVTPIGNDTSIIVGTGTIAVYVEDPLVAGCGGLDTVQIATANPQALILGADSICPGYFDTLSVAPSFSSYLWSNGDTTATTSANSGVISVTVTDIYGCTDDTSSTIYYYPTASPDFIIDPLPQGQPGVEITFTDNSSGNIIAWSWDFGDGFTDNNQNTTHIYDLPNNYPVTLTVVNEYNCLTYVTQDYLVVSDIVIPNVFTPNNDNSNDFLVFTNLEYFDNHLDVFNRWGLKIYEKDNYQNDWDGEDYSDGTYFFVLTVQIPKAEIQTFKGSITMIR